MSNEDTDEELNKTLRSVFAGGKVHKLKWDWDESWDMDRRFKYACDLAASMNQAADIMQKEKVEILEELTMAKKKQAMAEELRDIDNKTLTEVITQNNADRQADAALIQKLQNRIKNQEAVIEALNGDNS